MTRSPRNAYIAVSAVGVALAVVATLAVAKNAERRTDPVATDRGKANIVDKRLVSNFAVLRRSSASSVRDSAKLPLVGRRRGFGLNLKLARVARTVRLTRSRKAAAAQAMTYPVAVVPGTGWVCLSSIPTANLCAPIADAVAQGIIGWGQCGPIPNGKVAVYGLLPDDASSPQIQFPGDGRATVEVVNNVLYREFAVDALPDAVVWEASSGTVVRELSYAPDVTQVVCDRE